MTGDALWNDDRMAASLPSRGSVMMIVGGLMVAFAVVTVVVSTDPMPVPLAVIGLVLIAVGSRRRRSDSDR